jgi:hypothetical protein
MSVQMILALPAGNATQLYLQPPAGAVSWRVLRRLTPTFTGPDDAQAFVVADRSAEAVVTDILNLENGRTYHYRVFYRDRAGAWMPVVDEGSAVPAATYRGDDLDVQTLVRDRLELGLMTEVARKRVTASTKTGRIEVTLAPFGLADTIVFPTVSVHLDHEASSERGIGENVGPDVRLESGDWTESQGWLSRVALQVVAVSDNPITRLALRRALRRIIQANLPVFEAKGMLMVDFQQKDMEDTSFNAPLYFSIGTFSCLAPAFVEDDVADVEDVAVTLVPI